MKSRMKASDVFERSTPLFGRKVTFDVAFPQVADITLEIREQGKVPKYLVADDGAYVRTYQSSNFPGQFVDCSNSLCYNGGVGLGPIVREMVRTGATVRETSSKCQGYEGSPKGRRKYRTCRNVFTVKVLITYEDQRTEEVGSA